MIHHVGFEVSDLARSAEFYDAMLAPLGWRRMHTDDGSVGWGLDQPVFWITARRSPTPGFGHVAFSATGIVAVKAAWDAGIAAGGQSEGKPGPRRQYGPGYYSAYLQDPDGYSLEIAVRS